MGAAWYTDHYALLTSIKLLGFRTLTSTNWYVFFLIWWNFLFRLRWTPDLQIRGKSVIELWDADGLPWNWTLKLLWKSVFLTMRSGISLVGGERASVRSFLRLLTMASPAQPQQFQRKIIYVKSFNGWDPGPESVKYYYFKYVQRNKRNLYIIFN